MFLKDDYLLIMPEIRYAGYMATMLLFRRIYAS